MQRVGNVLRVYGFEHMQYKCRAYVGRLYSGRRVFITCAVSVRHCMEIVERACAIEIASDKWKNIICTAVSV